MLRTTTRTIVRAVRFTPRVVPRFVNFSTVRRSFFEEDENQAIRRKENSETIQRSERRQRDPACTIFVRNISFKTSPDGLKSFFEDKFGPVANVVIPVDQESGRPRGFGFVEFNYADSAQEAIALETMELDGRQIYTSSYDRKPRIVRPQY
jgi:RNA recognition motif-containing protein